MDYDPHAPYGITIHYDGKLIWVHQLRSLAAICRFYGNDNPVIESVIELPKGWTMTIESLEHGT